MPVAKRKFYVYKNGRYYEGSFNDGTVADDYDSTDTYSVGDLVLYKDAPEGKAFLYWKAMCH